MGTTVFRIRRGEIFHRYWDLITPSRRAGVSAATSGVPRSRLRDPPDNPRTRNFRTHHRPPKSHREASSLNVLNVTSPARLVARGAGMLATDCCRASSFSVSSAICSDSLLFSAR